MNATRTVDILLATFNGDRYLSEQIDSILAQTFGDWRLIVRDDGSTDRTVDILRNYAARHPGRIVLLEDSDRRLGACANFGRLMEHASADYVMFCDQDDVWLPQKIEKLLDAAKRIENQVGTATPVLIHSDLIVVDEARRPMAPSFWRYQALGVNNGHCLNRLLLQNVVTGCAAIMNRSLLTLARPVPPGVRMHDWWVALVAAAFGRIEHVCEALVEYRQHGGNALGAKRWDIFTLARLLVGGSAVRICRNKRKILRATQDQAAEFARRFGHRLSPDLLEMVQAYAAFPELGFLNRRIAIIRFGFVLDSPLKCLALLVVA